MASSIAASFSVTAPKISAEQLAAEKAKLSQDEKNWIHNDVYGTSLPVESPDLAITFANNIVETREYLESQVEAMMQEMEYMPFEAKKEYLEALERCPDLVQYETNPIRFLRTENYIPRVGAQRLAKYWKMRKLVFKERAFLPMMVIDGENGCLTRNEVALIEEFGDSTTHVCPNDIHGRTIVFIDRRHEKIVWPKHNIDRDNSLRIFWYLLHTVMFDQDDLMGVEYQGQEYDGIKASKGFVIVIYANISQMPQYDRLHFKSQYDVMKFAIPHKVRSVHLCDPSSIFRSFVLPFVRFIAGRHVRMRLRIDKSANEAGGNNQSLVVPLREYGMEKHILPTTLGGTFVFKGLDWCNEQRRREEARQLLLRNN